MTTTMSSAARFRGVSARIMLLSVPLLVLALIPHPSRADAIYTWHSTPGGGGIFATGSLDVSQQALIDGFISYADIKTFDFRAEGTDFTNTADFSPLTLPIDSAGIPTTTGFELYSSPNKVLVLFLPFDALSFDESAPIIWSGALPGNASGAGYWTVITGVPEPSSVVLMVSGAITVLAYGLVRKRQAQRWQGVGGQPQPME
jgi:hypothetical protein